MSSASLPPKDRGRRREGSRVRRHRQTGTGSTNHNTDCCVGGIMVVDVASDALLDSPGRLFWPVVICRVESRHTCPTHAGPKSFCTILLLSTLPSHISNACTCSTGCPTDRSTALHYYTTPTPTPAAAPHYHQATSCNSCNPLPTLPVVDLLPASTSTHHVIPLAR
jgi:hypothetical protein